MNGIQLQNVITSDEVKIIQISLQDTIEVMESNRNTVKWNKEAIKQIDEMLKCAKSALVKIQKISGFSAKMDPYKEGDEKEFLK